MKYNYEAWGTRELIERIEELEKEAAADRIGQELDAIADGIVWENYEEVDEDTGEKTHWSVAEVLYNKIDSALDGGLDEEEIKELLHDLQGVIEAMQSRYKN